MPSSGGYGESFISGPLALSARSLIANIRVPNELLPVIQSGSLSSGQYTTSLVYGTIYSGAVSSDIGYPYVCVRCRTRLYEKMVTIGGGCGLMAYYCWDCAGVKINEGSMKGIETREDWIRDTLPVWITPDAPGYVIADWLEDQGRHKDAVYMRGLESGG